MSKSKAELQEELELVQAELAATKAALEECRTESQRAIEKIKLGVKKQSDQLQEARDKIYNEAKEIYASAITTARDVYKDFEQQVPENMGMLANGVRDQVMYTLKQIFGDEL